jgi:phosphoribosylamine-glycine ligase
MEKVGVLVVSYGAREAAMVDAFARSPNYKVELYIADKQRNPFNVEKAAEHVVIPDLNVEKICKFAENNKDKIDFAMVGPEKPIANDHTGHLPNTRIRHRSQQSSATPIIPRHSARSESALQDFRPRGIQGNRRC